MVERGDMSDLDFSIVTPSFNMLSYLKSCHRSILDQQGVKLEHIVVDGGSEDGTAHWLKQQNDVISVSESDEGMYDAINKGLRMSQGRIIAYLNCDEQYLPGTLGFVKDWFERHPDVDVLFGDTLLIRPDGSFLSCRKGFQPRWFYILSSYMYVISCSMFLRRRIIDNGMLFDKGWRVVGDAEFVTRLLRSGYTAAHVGRYLAAFTMTGSNMNSSPKAYHEMRRLIKMAPAWVSLLRYPIYLVMFIEKVLSGAYQQKVPMEYAVYISGEAKERTKFNISKVSFRWPTVRYNAIP